MYHLVTMYFDGKEPIRFKVLADTPTGAAIAVLAFDWSVEQRKAFHGSRVDPYVKGTVI